MNIMRKKILVICPYPEKVAPAQRLKYEQYFSYFKENGYDVTVSPFMTRAFWKIVYENGHYLKKFALTLYGYVVRIIDLFRLPFYDIVYITLWVVPFGPSMFERLFCMINSNIVYDIDDLIFLKPQSKANPLVAIFKSKSRITCLLRNAKHVITCTPTLDEFARKYNSRTTDISSTINTETYVPVNRYTNTEPITIGWSGSHSTIQYLYLLKNVLLDLNQEYRFRLVVIGGTDFKIEGLNATILPWSEEQEIIDLQKIDIGLYPLPNEEWVFGKSGLKALQYMALGIPTVATAIGANFRVIEDGISGFLVKSDDEWKDKIRLLINDSQLRRKVGMKARERVEMLYSIRANRDTYLSVLDRVSASRSVNSISQSVKN